MNQLFDQNPSADQMAIIDATREPGAKTQPQAWEVLDQPEVTEKSRLRKIGEVVVGAALTAGVIGVLSYGFVEAAAHQGEENQKVNEEYYNQEQKQLEEDVLNGVRPANAEDLVD